jgi:hypothetical protein
MEGVTARPSGDDWLAGDERFRSVRERPGTGTRRPGRPARALTEQLHSTDEALRRWAAAGLQLLDSHDARQILYQARAHGLIR